jgi:hypothetical protein
MSFGFAGLHVLVPILQSLGRGAETRILVLGTQDITFTYEQAETFLRSRGLAFHSVPPEVRRTTNSFAHVAHEDWWQYKDFLHQETLFRMLGFQPSQVATLDVDDYEHAEIIHDLNQPLPPGIGQFDFILDQGTLEHVFDIRQALWNLSDLMKDDGQILHMVPAGFLNHGFYNFNALLFGDFYTQAGWVQEKLCYLLVPKQSIGDYELFALVDPNKLTTIPPDFYLNVFGHFRKRPGAIKPVAVQGLYLGLHDAWNHQSRDMSRLEPPAGYQAPRLSLADRLRLWWRRQAAMRTLHRMGAESVLLERPPGASDRR